MPKGIYEHKPCLEETKLKISLSNKGRKHTKETKEKIGAIHRGKIVSEETRIKISKKLKGKKVSEITKKKLSKQAKNRKSWNKGKKNIYSKETREKMSEAQKGEKHHNWQGGKTQINKAIRKTLKYKLWREAIFERDNYTCQHCNKRGGKLNADHIKPFSLYPELRFELDNGRTLCVECHRKTNTYGSKSWCQQEYYLKEQHI